MPHRPVAMTARLPVLVACALALVRAVPASADDPFGGFEETADAEPNPYGYAWSDARMLSRIGIGLMFGGGVTGFTDPALRDLISDKVGGVWNVRVAIGTHIPIGVELAYFGSAAKLQTLADDYGGMLIGTTFEAALRYTILPLADGTPYVFAGAGWQRYDVRDAQLALADTGMRDGDQLAEFPLGAGAAYRDRTGWVGDVRGTFRLTTDSSLLATPSGEHARLYSWEASAAIGYEF